MDDAEILFSHIDLLTSKLEILHTSTATGSYVDQQLQSSPGKQWMKTLDTFSASFLQNPRLPPAQLNTSTIALLKDISSNIAMSMDMLRYAVQYCILTESQLNLMLNMIKDLDIRWNLHMTKRICELFVQYCKTVVFFKKHPILKYIAGTAVHMTTHPDLKKHSDAKTTRRIFDYILRASDDPFQLIKRNLSPDKGKEPRIAARMARLVSSIGTFIARLFGSFPLVEWEQFSVFNNNSTGSESTLMTDEFLVLSNLTLFKETLFFFMFSFPDHLKSNPCFALIVEAVLTETPVVSITRTIKIPLKDFFALTTNQVANQRLVNSAEFLCQSKFQTSHVQRIMHVTFELQDILNICEYDPTQLRVMMNHVIALTGFAFYELDSYFTFGVKSAEAMELLSVLVEIGNLIGRSSDDLQRFFVYNLATVDYQFLKAQLNPSLSEFLGNIKERNIAALVNDLAHSLESLDLPEFDNGVRYDFTSFLVTYGRVLRAFNDIKNRERISFLDPIFEHLSTIRIHATFAQSPLEAFLSYCPLHTLWRHHSTFMETAKSKDIPLDRCAALLNLFTFFSMDQRCLKQLLGEVKQLTQLYPNLRSAIMTKLIDIVATDLKSSTSQHVKIALQSHDFYIDNGFQVRDFTIQHGGMTKNLASLQIKSIQIGNQVKKFCGMVPSQVVVFDKTDKAALFYANQITLGLANFLFPNSTESEVDTVPDPGSLDMSFAAASQYLWSVFAELGSSFTRQLFDCRFAESLAKDDLASFDQQVAMLDGTTEFQVAAKPKSVLERQKQRLVTRIEQKFMQFLTSDVSKAVYLPNLKGFWSTANLSYDTAKYFSYRGMLYMIQSLGLHCGTRVDRIFLHRAAKSMKVIITEFLANKQIKGWLQDFLHKDQIPSESINGRQFASSINELITLGVVMQLRTLLREAMSQSVGAALPGFRECVHGAKARNKLLNSPIEALLVEVATTDEDYTFLEEIISNSSDKPRAMTDLNEFMFFIALLMNNSHWDDVRYLPDYDAFTENLHLIPVAVKVFIRELSLVFEPGTATQLHLIEAYKVFFAALSAIVTHRKSRHLDSSAKAITILADMFPRVVNFEYGRIEESFPLRFINFAYSEGVPGMPPPKK